MSLDGLGFIGLRVKGSGSIGLGDKNNKIPQDRVVWEPRRHSLFPSIPGHCIAT